jgi:hypothetical protein
MVIIVGTGGNGDKNDDTAIKEAANPAVFFYFMPCFRTIVSVIIGALTSSVTIVVIALVVFSVSFLANRSLQ